MQREQIKIKRPKGYVNIDEVYRALGGVELEKDYEYGDYGEVLSECATCDYGDVLNAVSSCNVVRAIPLDKVKKAREELDKIYEDLDGYDPQALGDYASHVAEILDKLIEESGSDSREVKV